VTHSLSSFTIEGSSNLHTYISSSFVSFSYSLSLFLYLLYFYYHTSIKRRAIRNAVRSKRSDFTFHRPRPPIELLQNHITKPFIPILPQFAHSLFWIFGTPPLLRQSDFFFFMFCHRLTSFALRKPRVLRWQPPLLHPVFKLVILFLT
jgi:hypothetical protein